MELEPLDFDLEHTMHDALQVLAPKAAKKGLELLLHFTPGCPNHLLGDPGRLRQVLLNLTGNAVKFTVQGHILVEARYIRRIAGQAELELAIEDTGIGISEEARERLFQSFTQADTSTTRRYGGTGLELAISRSIVELMGGQIGVESEPGKGSRFWIRLSLPMADVLAPLPQKKLTEVLALVVDDNPVSRQILANQLSSFDMLVETAGDASEALALLRAAAGQEPFRIALLDYLMPGMDGESLARAIHQSTELSDTRMLLLTSAGQKGDVKRFSEAGVSAYLTKPVLLGTLRATLASVLGLEDDGEAPLITRHRLDEAAAGDQVARFSSRILPVSRSVAHSRGYPVGTEPGTSPGFAVVRPSRLSR